MPEAYNDRQKLAAIDREISFRVRVYEKKIAEGKMTRQDADYEIGIMKAIAADYRDRIPPPQPTKDMFG